MLIKKILLLITLIFYLVCANAHAELSNKIVAVVNDEVITQQDINQLLAVLYAQYVHQFHGDELLKKMEEVSKDILKQIIEDKLILSRAKELNIKITEREVNDKLEYIKNGFPSEDEFYETLEAQGITISNLKDRYRDQIMMKKLVDLEIKSRVSVLPSEISEYYEKHRSEFKQNEKYRVRHILIKAADEMSSELAKLEIEDIYKKLLDGADFSELARQYSQGPNRDEGGDMGHIEPGQMREELNEVIFSLKNGEFSEPVKSEIGYHIFKVAGIQQSDYPSLEEMQNDIKKFMFQQKFQKKLDEWVAELANNAYISIK